MDGCWAGAPKMLGSCLGAHCVGGCEEALARRSALRGVAGQALNPAEPWPGPPHWLQPGQRVCGLPYGIEDSGVEGCRRAVIPKGSSALHSGHTLPPCAGLQMRGCCFCDETEVACLAHNLQGQPALSHDRIQP